MATWRLWKRKRGDSRVSRRVGTTCIPGTGRTRHSSHSQPKRCDDQAPPTPHCQTKLLNPCTLQQLNQHDGSSTIIASNRLSLAVEDRRWRNMKFLNPQPACFLGSKPYTRMPRPALKREISERSSWVWMPTARAPNENLLSTQVRHGCTVCVYLLTLAKNLKMSRHIQVRFRRYALR